MRQVYIFDCYEAIAFLRELGCPEELLQPIADWGRSIRFTTVSGSDLKQWREASGIPEGRPVYESAGAKQAAGGPR